MQRLAASHTIQVACRLLDGIVVPDDQIDDAYAELVSLWADYRNEDRLPLIPSQLRKPSQRKNLGHWFARHLFLLPLQLPPAPSEYVLSWSGLQ